MLLQSGRTYHHSREKVIHMATIKIHSSKMIGLYEKNYFRHPGKKRKQDLVTQEGNRLVTTLSSDFLIATLSAKQQWSNMFNIFENVSLRFYIK